MYDYINHFLILLYFLYLMRCLILIIILRNKERKVQRLLQLNLAYMKNKWNQISGLTRGRS